jgi:hypothetical protein
MILVLKQSHYDPTEFGSAMAENAPFLLDVTPVVGKPVQGAFDGGRLPESGVDVCSQPTMCRIENLPGKIAPS